MRLDPDNDQMYSLLSRALWEKSAWQQSVDFAGKAIALNPSNAAAHLWRADSLRHLADRRKERQAASPRPVHRSPRSLSRVHQPDELRILCRIEDRLPPRGVRCRQPEARRSRSTVQAQRVAGFLGLCITEQRVGLLKRAREVLRAGARLRRELAGRPLCDRQRVSRHGQTRAHRAAASASLAGTIRRSSSSNPGPGRSETVADGPGQPGRRRQGD
jgi:hypothetical protein